MNPIEKLNHEHGMLHLLLAALDRQAQGACGGEPLNIDTTRDMLDLIRVYAVGVHQSKETKLLMPKLRAAGVPFDVGPLYLMGQEHTQIKDDLALLYGTFDDLYAGDRKLKGAFLRMVPPLVRFLRLHMLKEENSVFPYAFSGFSGRNWRELQEAFEHTDEVFGKDAIKSYEDRIQAIGRQFGLGLHRGRVAELERNGRPKSAGFTVKSWQAG